MNDIKFLIILVYFERPNMVENALCSIRSQTYSNYHVAFIDDGSKMEGSNVAVRYINRDRLTLYRVEDTVEQKIQQGGSRHGEIMNIAIDENPSDVVVILCDDDALMNDYLEKLNEFYIANPECSYSYCHVRPFNPFHQFPMRFEMDKRSYFTNITHPVNASCVLDSSQVTYRTDCNNVAPYRQYQTTNHDAVLYADLYEVFGPCVYNGIEGQYKGYFPDQMGTREDMYIVKDLPGTPL